MEEPKEACALTRPHAARPAAERYALAGAAAAAPATPPAAKLAPRVVPIKVDARMSALHVLHVRAPAAPVTPASMSAQELLGMRACVHCGRSCRTARQPTRSACTLWLLRHRCSGLWLGGGAAPAARTRHSHLHASAKSLHFHTNFTLL